MLAVLMLHLKRADLVLEAFNEVRVVEVAKHQDT